MILQGNSYRIPLADESVHCTISSFPYFGLRSYNLPPTIWGGSTVCLHIWGESLTKYQRGKAGDQSTIKGAQSGGRTQEIEQGQFCQLCQAWLGCFGLEPTIALHVSNAVAVCREIKRVLRKDGVFFLNYGDSYATGKNGRSAADTKAVGKDDRTFRDKPFSITELPAKNLCLIPFRVALALQDDGWIIRSDIIWEKPNSMPESVTDRPSKSHEYIFMLVKSARYFYDGESVRVPTLSTGDFERRGDGGNYKFKPTAPVTHMGANPAGRNLRTVWTIPTESFSGAHYATFPRKLVEPMILAATSARGVCPECGAPWERITEDTPQYAAAKASQDWTKNRGKTELTGNEYGRSKKASITKSQLTTGWQPTCKCKVYKLREDLSEEERKFVLVELKKVPKPAIIS